MFQDNIENTRATLLTWFYCFLAVNFGHISHVFLGFLLLSLLVIAQSKMESSCQQT